MKLMCGTHAVLKAFSKTNERGKLVAAICAGPVLLAKAGVLKGRKATCYPGMENEISEGGAAPSKGNVVTDGNVITSRGPGTSAEFALAVLRSLHGDEIAGKAAEGLLL